MELCSSFRAVFDIVMSSIVASNVCLLVFALYDTTYYLLPQLCSYNVSQVNTANSCNVLG